MEKIVVAAQKERFTRKKHDRGIPKNAIKYVCGEGVGNIDYVVFYDNSILTLDRFIKNTLACGEDSKDLINFSFDKLFQEKIWVKELIENVLDEIGCITENTRFLMTKHHISHAASAFYSSPYEKGIIFTIDGVGEWTTLSIGVGNGNKIELKEELKYPHSLGLFYSAFTYFCGFKVNEGDYKFMGLAPYGEPIYEDIIRENIIEVKEDGSFRLNLQYFDFQNGRTMINEPEMAKLFGGGRRLPETEITLREMNIAASVQKITEDIIIKLAKYAKEKYGDGIENLCIAGGVGLNCVANGKLRDEGIFENIWVQPAAGDAGGSLGAALFCWYSYLKNDRTPDDTDSMQGSYLGISYEDEEIKKFLDDNNCIYKKFNSDLELAECTADLLHKGNVIGLFEGRMEFGPRSLGNRSIIADPRSEVMQSRLNLKIKFRESFRPFAPSVLEEYAEEYFENGTESPYMLFVSKVRSERREKFDLKKSLTENLDNMLPVVNKKRSDVPAITHVDYSARVPFLDEYLTDYPSIKLLLRGDSGFATPELYKQCEENGVSYVIRLKENATLRKEASFLVERLDEITRKNKVDYAVVYDEFMYQASSWPYKRRVVCKVEKTENQLTYMYTFIVTNMDSSPEYLIRFYCKRGMMENYIKESKSGFDFASVSSHSKIVNAN